MPSSRFHDRGKDLFHESARELRMDSLAPMRANSQTAKQSKSRRSSRSRRASKASPRAKKVSVKQEKPSAPPSPFSPGLGVVKVVTQNQRDQEARDRATDLVTPRGKRKSIDLTSPFIKAERKMKVEGLSGSEAVAYRELKKLHDELLKVKNECLSTLETKDQTIQKLESDLSNVQDESMKHLLKLSKLTRENVELENSFPNTPHTPRSITPRGAAPRSRPPRSRGSSTKKSLFSQNGRGRKRRKTKRKHKKQRGGGAAGALGAGAVTSALMASGADDYMYPGGITAGYAAGELGKYLFNKYSNQGLSSYQQPSEAFRKQAQARRGADGV